MRDGMVFVSFVLLLEELIPAEWSLVEAAGPAPGEHGRWRAIVATGRGDEELNFGFDHRKPAEVHLLRDEIARSVETHVARWIERGEAKK